VVDIQPNDGFGTLLPLETIDLDVIFSAVKLKVVHMVKHNLSVYLYPQEYSFTLRCKSGIDRCMSVCLCVCALVCTCMCLCLFVCYAHARTFVCACARVCTWICLYVWVCVLVCMHAYPFFLSQCNRPEMI